MTEVGLIEMTRPAPPTVRCEIEAWERVGYGYFLWHSPFGLTDEVRATIKVVHLLGMDFEIGSFGGGVEREK